MGMGKIVDLNQFILQLEKAVANGVATLDSSVKVPKSQISLTASDVGAIATNDSNAILTTLNAAPGTISSSILPSYVDDFLVFANLAAFPVSGESGKIYLAENTNLSYRWTGASYVDISSAGISDAALKLNTPRTIASTGDGSWNVNFDGSTNVSAALTLATVNSNTGSFGSSTQIPTLTIDAKGRITSASNSSIGNELIALQALADTTGFLRKTGDGAYEIDTNSYLPLTGGTVSGVMIFSNNTQSTSPTTGALLVSAGGLGVFGNTNIGGSLAATLGLTPNTQVVVSASTVTPAAGNDVTIVTAQAAALTLANPTGTWARGKSLIIRIKDNGTARTISYGTKYRAIGVVLPTATTANKAIYLGCIYNLTDDLFDVIGVTQE